MSFVAADKTLAEQMDAVLSAVPATVWVTGRDLRFQVSRGVVARRDDLSHDAVLGTHVDDYLGKDADTIGPLIRQALEGHRATYLTKPGDGRELENYVGPLYERGAITGVVGVTIDVTDRNQLLRERDDRLRLMLGQVPAFLWTTDRDLRVTQLLGEAAGGSGLTPVGTTLREFWGPEDPVGAVAAHMRAVDGESVEDESTFEGRTLASHLEPLRDAANETVGVIGVAFDVTVERELQRNLESTAKLAALGRLAGGIAHDFNNMLLGIKGYIDLALAHTEANGPARAALEGACAATARSTALTQQLLAFSQDETVTPRQVAPGDLIRISAGLLARLVGPMHRLEVKLGDPLPEIVIDPTQFEQLLTNLVTNARDAMPDGGAIRIESACRELTEGQPAIANDLHAGTWVELSVADSGAGMSRDTVDLVFEPLFTTKETGHGLGLATVFRIMQQGGGSIVVDSAPATGTTMRLFFPARDGECCPENIVTAPDQEP